MNRRNFIVSAAAVSAAASVIKGVAQTPSMNQTLAHHNTDIQLGVATYSLRKFKRAEAIAMIKELGVVNCNVKDMHLPMTDSPEKLAADIKEFTDAGLKIVGGGNVSMQKEEMLRPAFVYAKACGFPVIVCIPSHATLPKVEELVKEFNIPVAIHNHGPEEKEFHSPYDVLDAVKKMDPRMGLCIDVGHTLRSGVDIVKAVADAGPRLYSMHAKDLANNSDRDSQVAVGRGIIPFRAIFAQLTKMKWKGSVDLEYEIKADNPMPGMLESFGFMRGVLDGMKS